MRLITAGSTSLGPIVDGLLRRSRSWWPIFAVIAVAAVALSNAAAAGGFTATVTNAGNTVQAGSLLTSASSGVTECDLGTATYNPVSTANNALCTGSLVPNGILPGTGTGLTATVVTDRGSLPATSTTLSKSGCGPIQLANSVNAADPMLVRGSTLSYAQAGPLTGSTGLGLSGGATGTGFAADVTASAPTNKFTEVIWFKATTNGTLIGSTSTPSAYSPSNWDRMLWLDSTGHVVFAVYPGSTVELTSPASSYLDGKWHMAAGSISTAGMVLSIDGATVASNTTTTTAEVYNGYWHVGWDNEATGWTNPPTTPYLAGTLADAAIFPTLTAAQITNLYKAGTQSAWLTYLTSYGAINAWALGDTGATAYTGTIPSVSVSACAFVDVTVGVVGLTSACAAPVRALACLAPTSALTLASLAASTSTSVAPTLAQPLTLTVIVARDATTTVAAYPYATGLHVTAGLTVTNSNGGFSAALSWPATDLVL